MSSAQEDRKSDTAEEMEAKMEDREQVRREAERGEWEDLNQSIQTGTHDATRRGIRWGASYKTRRRKSKAKQGRKDPQKN